jgi:hypothetical protein
VEYVIKELQRSPPVVYLKVVGTDLYFMESGVDKEDATRKSALASARSEEKRMFVEYCRFDEFQLGCVFDFIPGCFNEEVLGFACCFYIFIQYQITR